MCVLVGILDIFTLLLIKTNIVYIVKEKHNYLKKNVVLRPRANLRLETTIRNVVYVIVTFDCVLNIENY